MTTLEAPKARKSSKPLNVAPAPVIKSPVWIGNSEELSRETEAVLVETFAAADRAAKIADKAKAEARAALLEHFAKSGKSIAKSATAIATLKTTMRASLDTKAVQVEMGSIWYDARCKVSDVQTVSVTWLV